MPRQCGSSRVPSLGAVSTKGSPCWRGVFFGDIGMHKNFEQLNAPVVG